MSLQDANRDQETDLQFGVFDWVDDSGRDGAGGVYDGRLRLLTEADRGGFSTYHIAEHHGTPLGLAPSPALFVAAAARITERIRLAPTTFIVPLYDPLRLAEEIGMLDQLCHGRLDVGVGKGGSPHEAALYGLTPQGAVHRLQVALPALLEALATGWFQPLPDSHGHAREPVELHVRPVQRPHPPLWYPTSNPDSIPRLAQEGYNTIFGFGFTSPPLEDIRTQSRVFFDRHTNARRREQPERGSPGQPPRFGILRHVFVAETDTAAMRTARAAFADHYDSFVYLGRRAGDGRFPASVDFDDLVSTGKVCVGSADTVAGQLSEAVTVGELNYLAASFMWGTLGVEQALASLRLFRDHVIPAVREAAAVVPQPATSW